MSDDRDETLRAYVDAAAQITSMPLAPDRRAAVTITLTRVATFAAHLEAFDLAPEIAAGSPSATGSAP
jgi:hypothetical protein